MLDYGGIARLIQEALPVLMPSPDFSEALGYRLLLAAGELPPEAGASQTIYPKLPAKRLLLGTAAVSLMGAALFLWRAKGVHGAKDLVLAAVAEE